MKRIIIVMLLFVSMAANAQKEVTKFLGIPIDGTKSAMIQKLKAKGFQYDYRLGCLTGEFNGSNVLVSVVTNKNKVWRIMLTDVIARDEVGIKIRFNDLVRQFMNNKKYTDCSWTGQMLYWEDQTISDSEDISYEMTVNKKRYQAVFYQLPSQIDLNLKSQPVNKNQPINFERIKDIYDSCSKRSVWFMIDIDEVYGEYRILMYYDNEYNQSDGEDL